MTRAVLPVVESSSANSTGRVRERKDRKVTSEGKYWQLLGKGKTLTNCRAADLTAAMVTFKRWLDDQEFGEVATQHGADLKVEQVFDLFIEHKRTAHSRRTRRPVAARTLDGIMTTLTRARGLLFVFEGSPILFGSLPARHVTEKMVGSMLDQMRAPLNSRNLAQQWTLAALNWGMDQGWYTADHLLPVMQERRRGETRDANNNRIPTEDDVRAVVGELRTLWHRVAIQMYAHFGMRVGELAYLTWDQVDLNSGLIDITAGKTHSRDYPLPVPARLLSLLLELKAYQTTHPVNRAGRVLGASREGINTMSNASHGSLARACRDADVPRFTIKGLRKHAIRRMLDQGVTLDVISALVGTSVKVIMKNYVNPTQGMAALQDSW